MDNTIACSNCRMCLLLGKQIALRNWLFPPRDVVIHYEIPDRRYPGAKQIRDEVINGEFVHE